MSLVACANASPTINTFTADPLTVNDGDIVHLAFTTSGGSVTLDGAAVSGSGSGSGSTSDVKVEADPYTAAIARTFTLRVTDDRITETKTVVVTVLRLPAAPVISAPASLVAPRHAVAVVSPEAGMKYTWLLEGAEAEAGEQSAVLSFRAARVGTVSLTCIAENALGVSVSSAVTSIPVYGGELIAGQPGVSGASDGPGTSAVFSSLSALQRASDGTLYALDMHSHTVKRLRAIGREWEVSTLAGSATAGGCANGTGIQARFEAPTDLWLDAPHQRLLVSEAGSVGRVRAVTFGGFVSTLIAGAGADGGCTAAAHVAALDKLEAVTTASNGDIYGYDHAGQIFDLTTASVQATLSPVSATATLRFDGNTLLMLDGDATCVRRAPSFACWAGGAPSAVDGSGASAGFAQPLGMAAIAGGFLIGDSQPASGGLVRFVSSLGVVTTVAGTASANRTTALALPFGVMPNTVSGVVAGDNAEIFVSGDEAILRLSSAAR